MEVNVAGQAVAAAACGVRNAVDTDVDNNGAGADHVLGYGRGDAHGGHQDIGLSRDVGQVLRAGVADGDGGVGAGPPLHQEGGQGLAHDVAAADDNYVLSVRIAAGADEDLLDAGGSTRQESGFALQHPALVDGMQTVNVLAGVNVCDGVGLAEVSGQGQLDQNAVEGGICVEAVDERSELLLSGVNREPEGFGEDAGIVAGAAFVAHVHVGRRVVAHQHGGQAGPDAGSGEQFGSVLSCFSSDRGGQFAAVEDSGGHRPGGLLQFKDVRAHREGKAGHYVFAIGGFRVVPYLWFVQTGTVDVNLPLEGINQPAEAGAVDLHFVKVVLFAECDEANGEVVSEVVDAQGGQIQGDGAVRLSKQGIRVWGIGCFGGGFQRDGHRVLRAQWHCVYHTIPARDAARAATGLPSQTDRPTMPVMRIVSLLPSATEMVFALGLGDSLVGVSHMCDYPAEARGRPIVSRSIRSKSHLSSVEIDGIIQQARAAGNPLYVIDGELLRRLRPDLILTQELCEVCAVGAGSVFETAAKVLDYSPEILSIRPAGLDDIFDNIRRIGAAAGASERAAGLLGQLERRAEYVAERAGDGRRPKVFCIDWLEPLRNTGQWTPELVELAGGEEGLAEKWGRSREVGWDEALDYQPDYVMVMPCAFDMERTIVETERLSERAEWNALEAVQEGRVYLFDGQIPSRHGPRVIDVMEGLAEAMRPDVFTGLTRPGIFRRATRPGSVIAG